MVRGFTPDGRILFVTTYGQPFFRNYRAFTLPLEGGMPELIAARAGQSPGVRPGQREGDRAQHRRSGALEALSRRHGRPPVDRRRRRRQFPPHDASSPATSRARCGSATASITCPTPKASAISIRAAPTAADQRRHTDHDDFYARHAQTDGRRIVYQCGARDLAVRSRARDATTRLAIDVPSHRTQAARKFVDAAENLAGFEVHPAGPQPRRRSARQAVHVRAVGRRGAPARRRPTASAIGMGQWLADGETIVAVSDETREERARRRCATARRARCRGTSAASSRCAQRPCGSARRAHQSPARSAARSTSRPVRCNGHRPQRLRPLARASHGRPTAPGSRTRSGPARGIRRSSSTTSRAAQSTLRHRRPSSATTARRSIRRASTSTSCRCARSIRSTTTCSSS